MPEIQVTTLPQVEGERDPAPPGNGTGSVEDEGGMPVPEPGMEPPPVVVCVPMLVGTGPSEEEEPCPPPPPRVVVEPLAVDDGWRVLVDSGSLPVLECVAVDVNSVDASVEVGSVVSVDSAVEVVLVLSVVDGSVGDSVDDSLEVLLDSVEEVSLVVAVEEDRVGVEDFDIVMEVIEVITVE